MKRHHVVLAVAVFLVPLYSVAQDKPDDRQISELQQSVPAGARDQPGEKQVSESQQHVPIVYQDEFGDEVVPEPQQSDPSSQKPGKRGPSALFALTGDFWFFPELQFSSGSRQAGINGDFSGGISFVGEGYLLPYLTVGVLVNFTQFAPTGHTNNDEQISLLSFDMTARFLQPIGSTKQFEIYFRLAVGYTHFLPSASLPDLETGEAASIVGWNVRLLPGFLYRTKSGVAFIAELGWAGAGYRDSYKGTDFNALVHSPSINLGIGYSF